MCLFLIRKLFVIFKSLIRFVDCVKPKLKVKPYLSFRHRLQKQLFSIIAIDKPIIIPNLVVVMQFNFDVTTIKQDRAVIVIAITLINSFKELLLEAFAK